jgi:hypothetical protein
MIVTFSKLQRLSGLTRPVAVKAWLKRQGVAYLRDAKGQPFTTLDAINRRLYREEDAGFDLSDPERRVPAKRQVLPRRQESLDRAHPSG